MLDSAAFFFSKISRGLSVWSQRSINWNLFPIIHRFPTKSSDQNCYIELNATRKIETKPEYYEQQHHRSKYKNHSCIKSKLILFEIFIENKMTFSENSQYLISPDNSSSRCDDCRYYERVLRVFHAVSW